MTTRKATPTLGQVVGENLRRLRTQLGITQDEMARRARMVGLPWTYSHVTNLESGRRDDLQGKELVLLCRAFGVPATYWFVGDGFLTVGDVRMQRHWVREDLMGTNATLYAAPLDLETARAAFENDDAFDAWRRAAAATTDVESNAARRLRVPPAQVRTAALRLWGRDLTAERDFRLAQPDDNPRSRSAQSGHITRRLIQELRDEITRGGRP